MRAQLARLPEAAARKLVARDLPSWIEPMLATLTDDRFSDDKWIFERKLDGERCLAFRDGDQVRMLSRNQKEVNIRYPRLVDAVARQDAERFILDGEIVAFEGDRTSFARLQQRMHVSSQEEALASDVDVYYYVFDLLYLDEYDLTSLGLRHRKTILKDVIQFEDPLRMVVHRNTDGETYYAEACDKGWEGIIAKQGGSPYIEGRSKRWLKFKCVHEQEFVIGGFTDPRGARIAFGALLLGYYRGDDLIYAGKVGTGFTHATLRRLHGQLVQLEQRGPPFANSDDLPRDGVHWVAPQLVAQIGFAEWTDYGKLRQPRYLGLRDDKSAQAVTREEPAS